VRADVDRGLEIRDEIEKLEVELKDIDARLKEAALLGEQVELTDADREGRQFLATGSERIVPVILTSDMIVGEFAMTSDRQMTVMDSLHSFDDRHEKFIEFFKPVRKFENRFDSGKKFRALAAEILGEKAPAFITACVARDKDGIPKSAIKVMWDDAKAK
jgi:hypothetical protein